MNEKEAWLAIARRFRTGQPQSGICLEIKWLETIHYRFMLNKIARHKGSRAGEWLYPTYGEAAFDEKYNILRAELCEKFAAELP